MRTDTAFCRARTIRRRGRTFRKASLFVRSASYASCTLRETCPRTIFRRARCRDDNKLRIVFQVLAERRGDDLGEKLSGGAEAVADIPVFAVSGDDREDLCDDRLRIWKARELGLRDLVRRRRLLL